MRRRMWLAAISLSIVARCFAGEISAPLDGEQVYQNNCSRCHRAIHTFPPRMMATVTRHMQVRATLTRAEQKAVLQYLLESSAKPLPVKKDGK